MFDYDYQAGTIPQGPAVRLWATGPTPEQERAIGDVFGEFRSRFSALDALPGKDALGVLSSGYGFGLLQEVEQTVEDIRAMRAGSDYRDKQLRAFFEMVAPRLLNPQLQGLYQKPMLGIFPEFVRAGE